MSSAQPWKMDEEGSGDEQMPLGVSSDAGEESYAAESKPKVNTSTLALFAAFAAALVVLYLLGLQNKPRTATAEELQRQQRVGTAIDEMLQHTEKGARIGNLLENTSRLVQLLLGALGNKGPENSDLPGNPFERAMVEQVVTGGVEQVLPPDIGEQERLRRMAEDFGKLKLQMVMMGSTPTAMINNQLVTPGAKVGEFFTVSGISPSQVVLSDGKRSFVLKQDGRTLRGK